jgi:hypothetical protein
VRWELDKSSHRLGEIDAKRGAAVRAMVHASLISSVLVNSIVHAQNRVTPTKADRLTRPPCMESYCAQTWTRARPPPGRLR